MMILYKFAVRMIQANGQKSEEKSTVVNELAQHNNEKYRLYILFFDGGFLYMIDEKGNLCLPIKFIS
jgi:hypothetical protein